MNGLTEKVNALRKRHAELQSLLEGGQKATEALARALSALRGAHGWATFDIAIGGAESAIAKHARLRKAQFYGGQARRLLAQFGEQLVSAQMIGKLSQQKVGKAAVVADFLADSIPVDWFVLDRIEKILRVYEQVHRSLQERMRLLQVELTRVQQDLEAAELQYQQMIEGHTS